MTQNWLQPSYALNLNHHHNKTKQQAPPHFLVKRKQAKVWKGKALKKTTKPKRREDQNHADFRARNGEE